MDFQATISKENGVLPNGRQEIHFQCMHSSQLKAWSTFKYINIKNQGRRL